MPATRKQIYFDHLAATPVLPEVLEVMRPFFAESFGSPTSLHQHGLAARDALDHAREQMAALLSAESPEEIIFTSSGTEAVNLAIKGTAFLNARGGGHFVATVTDHPAVLNSLEFLQKLGFDHTLVPVDKEGFADPNEVAAAITNKTILVCIHHANHDIGAIQPVNEVCARANQAGVPVMVDATASGGWLPINTHEWGASFIALATHRFYGPKGTGVLWRNRRARLASLIHGGTQQGGFRAGTENVPGIVGAGMAAEIARRELPDRAEHAARLQKKLWTGLRQKIAFSCLNGPEPGPRRIPTNLNLSFEFVEGEGVALMADVQGLSVASGAACVSKAVQASPVLAAIGLEHSLAQGNIIATFGVHNSEEEVEAALHILPDVVARLRALSPMWDEFRRGEIGSVLKC